MARFFSMAGQTLKRFARSIRNGDKFEKAFARQALGPAEVPYEGAAGDLGTAGGWMKLFNSSDGKE